MSQEFEEHEDMLEALQDVNLDTELQLETENNTYKEEVSRVGGDLGREDHDLELSIGDPVIGDTYLIIKVFEGDGVYVYELPDEGSDEEGLQNKTEVERLVIN